MRRLFLFAIGGTGARVVRSLAMMLASGINGLSSDWTIVPIIIDRDKNNGDKDRAIKALTRYRAIHRNLYAGAGAVNNHFFMTGIEPLGAVGHVGGDAVHENFELAFDGGNNSLSFNEFLGIPSMPNAADNNVKRTEAFLNALYDSSPRGDVNAELNLDLIEGFVGCPNIGSVVFNDLKSTREFVLFENIYSAANGDLVFIVSSIFGGTGAAGFPKIVDSIRSSMNVSNATIGAAVVLPYFNLNDKGAVDAGRFNSKAVAALSYYEEGGINQKVDALYYVGDNERSSYGYHTGMASQKNNAHVVEMIVASSIVRFMQSGVTHAGHLAGADADAYEYGLKNRKGGFHWSDFSAQSRTDFLDNLSVFTVAMHYYYGRVLGKRKQLDEKVAFYDSFGLAKKRNSGTFGEIKVFLEDKDWGYWKWLDELKEQSHAFDVFDRKDDGKTLFKNIVLKNPPKLVPGKHPLDDEGITRAMDRKAAGIEAFSDANFFKLLHDVIDAAYQETANKGELNEGTDELGYVFRIHAAPEGVAPFDDGWEPTPVFGPAVWNAIGVTQDAGRIGTSIPTMFARMYFFGSAFAHVAEAANGLLAGGTMYHKLVSECWDMLELIYQNADNPKLVIEEWNYAAGTNALRANNNQAHTRLADAIDAARNGLGNSIFLFYWKDTTARDGVNPTKTLIGGTSPLTLVFTSPNWKREMSANGWSFHRLDGSSMFDDNAPKALDQRGSEFQDMLMDFYKVYSATMAPGGIPGKIIEGLYKYLQTFYNGRVGLGGVYVPPIDFNFGDFVQKYSQVRTAGVDVNAGDYPLASMRIEPANDYKIRPSKPVAGHIPLMLSKGGIANLKYVSSAQWNPAVHQINDGDRDTDVNVRTLPGYGGIRYPYVAVFDFLEDKIVKLPYDIDSSHFVTAVKGNDGQPCNSQYLLPLKRKFFEYFTVEDVKKMLLIQKRDNGVKVELKVPIVGRDGVNTISLEQTYQGDSIVEDADAAVCLAFFPFYRTGTALDKYEVACIDKGGTTLKFIEQNNPINNLPVQGQLRHPKDHLLASFCYYSVASAFDAIELNGNGYRALLIPLMEPVNVGPDGQQYTFAVDLGTSNTFVAYTTDGGASAHPLEYGNPDTQVRYLSANNTLGGGFGMYESVFAREFIPKEIGGSRYKFPFKTATCECGYGAGVNPCLFGNVSVGFHASEEDPGYKDLKCFGYRTDIKWALENNPGNNEAIGRVDMFCLELMWMIKNKIMQNCGCLDMANQGEIRITYPEAMINRAPFQAAWNKALVQTGLAAYYTLVDTSESESPYYCFAGNIGLRTFVNVDIGGGTFDVLLVKRDTGGGVAGAYCNSEKFAADDLWSGGVPIAQAIPQDNGFIRCASNAAGKEPLINAVFANLYKRPQDVMSFIFQHDSDFHAIANVQHNSVLRSLTVVHYAAIIFHISRLLRKVGMAIPEMMTFTGLGSRYIDILLNDDARVGAVTKYLLEAFTGLKAPGNFVVKRNSLGISNPKGVTAMGAVQKNGVDAQYQLPGLTSIGDLGIDGVNGLHYDNIDGTVKTKVLNTLNVFCDVINGQKFQDEVQRQLGFTFDTRVTGWIKASASDSLNRAVNKFGGAAQALVKDSLFFYTLKDAIYQVSKKWEEDVTYKKKR